MRYQLPPQSLFIRNRRRLMDRMAPNSLAVFLANDLMPTNADATYNFKQDADLFHLSGIDQEETILVLFPDAPDPRWREVLFLRETNEEIAVWEGERYTQEGAKEVSGIPRVYWLKDFEQVFHTIMVEAESLYLSTNEHSRASSPVPTRQRRFVDWCFERYPLHQYRRSAPLMRELRMVKEAEEVAMLRKACNITAEAFERVLQTVRPGLMEYEIEAEMTYTFIKNGSRGHAYTPIVAGGANACVLHYTENDKVLKDGDLLLMDFGAEYGNYNADLSRTIPVNGEFSPRQIQVYEAVLDVQKKAIDWLRPGVWLDEYHRKVGEWMTDALRGLGLLTQEDIDQAPENKPAYKKYFMHGTSHHLGLAVHDETNRFRAFQPGMVFTCEPGIYIPEEGIGIRIENDVLITQTEPEDLMADIPRDPHEIMERMK